MKSHRATIPSDKDKGRVEEAKAEWLVIKNTHFIALNDSVDMDSIPQTGIQVDTRQGVSVRYTTEKAS